MTENEYFRPIDDLDGFANQLNELAVGTIWIDDCGFRWIYMGDGNWRGMCIVSPIDGDSE